MADVKDCPLKFASFGLFYYKDKCKCSKENCAWWIAVDRRCAMGSIACNTNHLKYIDDFVGRLLDLYAR